MTSKNQEGECSVSSHDGGVPGDLKREIDYDKFRSLVNDDSLREKMKKEGCLHGLNIYITESLERWSKMEQEIAITGVSGVGKSSLINALRNLKPSDEGAAAVDVVETTTEGKRYTYPRNPNVVLWDLPGMGTSKFKENEYLSKMNFDRFDVVVIVSAGRFLYNNSWLAKIVRGKKQTVIFVRTKIDLDMMNAERDHPSTFNEKECLNTIRNEILRNISDEKIQVSEKDVYLISSQNRDLYDFSGLDKTLKDMLSIKGEAIRFILQEHFVKEIETLQAANKNEQTFYKLASAVVGPLPIPNLETSLGNALLRKLYEDCLQKFCNDNKSLDTIEKELGITSTDLKRHLISYEENEETLLESTEKKMFSPFRRYLKYIVPIVGSVFSAHKTYASVKECLNIMCDKMAYDVHTLAFIRLARLQEQLKPKLL